MIIFEYRIDLSKIGPTSRSWQDKDRPNKEGYYLEIGVKGKDFYEQYLPLKD
jgi:hypothetical protein